MERKKYNISRFDFTEEAERLFSAGSHYMLFYIGRGSCYFTIDGKKKLCGAQEVVILKPGEQTKLYFKGGKYPLQVLRLGVPPELLRELSDEETRLLEAFEFVPFRVTAAHTDSEASMLMRNLAMKLHELQGEEAFYGQTLYERNLVSMLLVLSLRAHTDSEASMLMRNLAMKLHELQGEEAFYGQTLYERNLVSMLLVLSLRACIRADQVRKQRKRRNIMIDDIFRYIKEHLTEELSLEELEQEFFVSRYHICREFKRLTGQTPHAYIVKARLDVCRKYIEEGKPISEVYQLGGFGGYNHFFRAFKKEYGLTPKQYYKELKIRES